MSGYALPLFIIILSALGQAFWLGYRLSKPPKKLRRKKFFLIKGGKNE